MNLHLQTEMTTGSSVTEICVLTVLQDPEKADSAESMPKIWDGQLLKFCC